MMIALCITGIVLFIVSGFAVYLLIELWKWQDKHKVLSKEYQHLFEANLGLNIASEATIVLKAKIVELESELAEVKAKVAPPDIQTQLKSRRDWQRKAEAKRTPEQNRTARIQKVLEEKK